MKIIFAGGGTGGHLYPSIAVAEELRHNNIEILFLISGRGIDSRILMKTRFKYIEQDLSAFMGKGFTSKIKAVYKLIKGVIKVYPLINKKDKVFITGGFAAAPAAVVAKLKGAELYLHEQNSVMGLVNRIFAKFCKKVFLSFDKTHKAKGNIVITGNPVRKAFHHIKEQKDLSKKILIIGGSQGSRKINNIIASSIDFLMKEDFFITHQTGEGLLRETLSLYGDASSRYASRLTIYAYIDKPADFIASADIVVARAGSGTVFELLASGVPAIYVPFKAASDNHQYHNAKAVEEKGCALIMDENEATPEKFISTLKFMRENIDTFRENLIKNKPLNSAKIIVKEMGLQ